MEEEEGGRNPENGRGSKQQEGEGDHKVVKFLDSVDSYLNLLDSLSSTLREGWLNLAGARQSMGGSRINSTLFDLKYHSAATSLQVIQADVRQPDFALCKWVSSGSDNQRCSSEEAKLDKDELLESRSTNLQLRYRGTSEIQETIPKSDGTTLKVDDQVQKERSKSLSMFGTLVSPKLRASQLSFETALDTIVEIANMRSSLLSAYDQVLKDMESIRGCP